LTEQTGEWSIWPALFGGSMSAHVNLQPQWLKKFLRKALDAGQVGMIVRLVQRDWSPISLADKEVRAHIMYTIRKTAEKSGWDISIMKECLGQAKILNRLARLKAHGGKELGFADPYMILVPLELHARLARATKDLGKSGDTITSQADETESQSLDSMPAPLVDYEKEAEIYAKRMFPILEAEEDLVGCFQHFKLSHNFSNHKTD
jgi:hypothetical protein